jgi:hypothetical protein
MIVLGADTHKRSHTVAAVAVATGEPVGEQTVGVERRGFAVLLRWARALDDERVWALEDCRHVSGSLERFLIERGERVLRIPTHLTAKGRMRPDTPVAAPWPHHRAAPLVARTNASSAELVRAFREERACPPSDIRARTF